MAIREDLVSSAVTFLQDPSVSASPIENRIAFLQSKNLTKEEIDSALARAGAEPAPKNYDNYAPQQQMVRQPPQYAPYQQQYPWPQAPAELPKRDWRDWFIMATVLGGVGYGAYFIAKRYVYPLIAPPTPPQLEQDKASIDESFSKAFALLDQLSTDTTALKDAEAERTARLDSALMEVESVIGELKASARTAGDDSHRMNDDIRSLHALIPKALESHKESTDARLKELSTELKSLKTLMGQRMNPAGGQGGAMSPSPYSQPKPYQAPAYKPPQAQMPGTEESKTGGENAGQPSNATSSTPRPASVSTPGSVYGAGGSTEQKPASPFNTGIPPNRAAIPAWQMAASKKSAAPVNGTGAENSGSASGAGSSSQESSTPA